MYLNHLSNVTQSSSTQQEVKQRLFSSTLLWLLKERTWLVDAVTSGAGSWERLVPCNHTDSQVLEALCPVTWMACSHFLMVIEKPDLFFNDSSFIPYPVFMCNSLSVLIFSVSEPRVIFCNYFGLRFFCKLRIKLGNGIN